MITKEQFTKLMRKHIDYHDTIEEIENMLSVEIYECPVIRYGDILFDQTLDIIFKVSAIDTINWWLYEKKPNPELNYYDENNNIIPSETLDELWEIVKDQQN